MKLLLLIAVMVMAAPAFADTAAPTPRPSAQVNKAAKTDFTKPFIYDGLRQQLPSKPQDQPSVELKAGPASR
ncbi:MAG TPA: hypothetical protein VMO78_04720 [Rhizomicrobium sp.]|nr:hypothetical protein [Rhizomicrobium sp.]